MDVSAKSRTYIHYIIDLFVARQLDLTKYKYKYIRVLRIHTLP